MSVCQEQLDELEALSAIYGEELRLEDEGRYSMDIVAEGHPTALSVRLFFTLPPSYPVTAAPRYEISSPYLSSKQRRQLGSRLEVIASESPGQSIIYVWLEAVKDFLIDFPDEEEESSPAKTAPLQREDNDPQPTKPTRTRTPSPAEDEGEIPPIHSGEPLTDRKSHFQAHVAPITSKEDVRRVMRALCSNSKIARATHNMYAYRLELPNGSVLSDCEDDGEHGAGAKMLQLLGLIGASGVIVVISRWYGGVHLGPDRFKHINNLARMILEEHGFANRPQAESSKSGKKKGKK